MPPKEETPEEKASRLEADNTELQTELQKAKEQIASQQAEIQMLSDNNANAEQAIANLKSYAENLVKEKEAIEAVAAEEIKALSEQLNSASVNIGSVQPIINFQGTDYKIIGKAWLIDKRTVTIEELRADNKLFANLLSKKVGFIKVKK